ncbi:hypothetical protein DL95DRAFT_386579 [Leptodontidium sp. 2 PMI_412]|nr:hypothetical protein BKA61DRAFT_638465 [Leptodontidium sp. MPI-SDFR-AT-0119]KAH9217434.1 hypothetical protein DL95DRAFT_386579 [Leptodontidium sp. 2 PMI_412]
MLSKIILVALAASPLVSAHGKVAVMTADMGGNTTALGIMGGIVPGPGRNKVTEVDTTVFGKVNPMSDGLGKTAGGGKNTLAGMSAVVAQSGDVLPQVSDGGSLTGTWHTVTSDGAGPVTFVMDTTGTGAFSQGTKLQVTQQVPGVNGNIRAPKDRRFFRRMLISAGIVKRATNVNTDEPMSAIVPAGTKCTGVVNGVSGVCLVKIANSNPAGPFGGVIAMQMAGTGGVAAPAAASATAEDSAAVEASADNSAVQTEADTKRSFVAAEFSA